MPTSRRALLKNTAAAAAVLNLDWTRARAEGETVRIGMIYDLQGKRELAVKQYEKVLKLKNFQDAHKQAEQFIGSRYKKS